MLIDIKKDQRYIEYLYQFNKKRNYFYCHDLLEEVWLETNRVHLVLKYLIQLAVMQYKKKTNNEIGFQKMYQKIINRYALVKEDLITLGINSDKLKKDIEKIERINNFFEYELEIMDETINKKLKQYKA